MSIPCKMKPLGGFRLPTGYTELEYLESSGTQNIVIPTPNIGGGSEIWSQRAVMQFLAATPSLIGWNSKAGFYWGILNGLFSLGAGVGVDADDRMHSFEFSCTKLSSEGPLIENSLTVDSGQTLKRNSYPSALPNSWQFGLFAINERPDGYVGPVRLWRCKCWSETTRYDMRPVLNPAGEPGLWDAASKHFFPNSGSGSFGYRIKRTGETVELMSLRDPYYVPPSGVYARKVGENELELLSDTEETSGDGWEWFANTAEAYEHFGIVPLEEEFLTE